jgi:hypothetical protein
LQDSWWESWWESRWTYLAEELAELLVITWRNTCWAEYLAGELS